MIYRTTIESILLFRAEHDECATSQKAVVNIKTGLLNKRDEKIMYEENMESYNHEYSSSRNTVMKKINQKILIQCGHF